MEPGDCTPVDPESGRERWWGSEAQIHDVEGRVVANRKLLVLHDGLRLFAAGNPELPVRDAAPGDDAEDAGHKGINYRAAVDHRQRMLADTAPPTPVRHARVGPLGV